MEPTRDRVTMTFEESEGNRRPYIPDVLASQIDRYEKNLAVLETRLRPVLSQHNVVSEVRPEEISEHQLHEQLNRLDNANQGLETIISQIAL